MKFCSTIMAVKRRDMRFLSWPESLLLLEKWKKPRQALNRRLRQCMIPECWPGAIFILGESLIFRKSAKLPWNTIGPLWRLAIPLPIPGEQPNEDWLRHIRWERRPSHEEVFSVRFL